jgi:hypothetical protein
MNSLKDLPEILPEPSLAGMKFGCVLGFLGQCLWKKRLKTLKMSGNCENLILCEYFVDLFNFYYIIIHVKIKDSFTYFPLFLTIILCKLLKNRLD